MIELERVLTLLALALVTLITRCFFFISDQPWELPSWVERGLRYAPIAALSVVIVPEILTEILTTQGQLVLTWQDARIYGAAAGVAVYFWRRDTLMTILVGMAVFLPLHLGLGW